jgi:hypothetical protein
VTCCPPQSKALSVASYQTWLFLGGLPFVSNAKSLRCVGFKLTQGQAQDDGGVNPPKVGDFKNEVGQTCFVFPSSLSPKKPMTPADTAEKSRGFKDLTELMGMAPKRLMYAAITG